MKKQEIVSMFRTARHCEFKADVERLATLGGIKSDDYLKAKREWDAATEEAIMEIKSRRMLKGLKDLTEGVVCFIAMLDKVMKEGESVERGKKLAVLTNRLEISNDGAMHFTLGYSFRKIEGIKKRLNAVRKPDKNKK